MTDEQKISIPLASAFLCMDCDVIGNDGKFCTFCLSIALHPISSFLNRTIISEQFETFLTILTGEEESAA